MKEYYYAGFMEMKDHDLNFISCSFGKIMMVSYRIKLIHRNYFDIFPAEEQGL